MGFDNIIKIAIIQIFNDYEQKIWKTWVNSQDHGDSDSQIPCQAEVLTLEINETLHRFENMEPWNLQFFADALINELEEIIQKLGFLKTFNLNGQDMKKAIKGFSCSWQTKESAKGLSFYVIGNSFDNLMRATGVENIDIENSKAAIRNFIKNIVDTQVNPLLTKTQQKFQSLVLNSAPEIAEFHLWMNSFMNGEHIEFENLLRKIPEKFDKIEVLLEALFNDICLFSNDAINRVFTSSMKHFIHTLSWHVNENSKIDVKKLIRFLTGSHSRGQGPVAFDIQLKLACLEEFVDKVIEDIENGWYGLELLNYLVKLDSLDNSVPWRDYPYSGKANPYCNGVKWPFHPSQRLDSRTYEQTYHVRTKALQAGAIEFILSF